LPPDLEDLFHADLSNTDARSRFGCPACWLIVDPLSLCLICSTLVFAQGTGGRILGRVADSSGAVLAGVKVTLTNEATGVSNETRPTTNGDYGFPRFRSAPTRSGVSIWRDSRRTCSKVNRG
jgi:hypothetical protein